LPHGAGGMVVVVVGGAQPPAMQASQQLDRWPAHALPPTGGTHAAALRLTLHLVCPFAFVRQHVTAHGRPHVDFVAHFFTAEAQLTGRRRWLTATSMTAATQRR